MAERDKKNSSGSQPELLAMLLTVPEGRVTATTEPAERLWENGEGDLLQLVDPACQGTLQEVLHNLAEQLPAHMPRYLPELTLRRENCAQGFEAAFRPLDPESDPSRELRVLVVLRSRSSADEADEAHTESSQAGGFFQYLLDNGLEKRSTTEPWLATDYSPVLPIVAQPWGRLEPGEGAQPLLLENKLPLEQMAFLLHDHSELPETPVNGPRHFLLLPGAREEVLRLIQKRMQQHLDDDPETILPLEETLGQFHIRVEVNPFPLLRKALDEDLTFFHFQPILRLADQSVERFEALIRLKNENGKLLGPFQFIPPAEQHPRLIRRIDLHVLRKIARHLKGYPRLSVNVNISGCSLGAVGFAGRALETLRENGFNDLERLGIEITETAQINSTTVAEENLRLLQAEGVQIFLDDFGSSYSSGIYLRDLPVDVVKLDGSFCRELLINERCRVITRHMVDCIHECGCQAVAEWIDSEELILATAAMDFDFGQGFYLGKPLPLEELRDHPMFAKPA